MYYIINVYDVCHSVRKRLSFLTGYDNKAKKTELQSAKFIIFSSGRRVIRIFFAAIRPLSFFRPDCSSTKIRAIRPYRPKHSRRQVPKSESSLLHSAQYVEIFLFVFFLSKCKKNRVICFAYGNIATKITMWASWPFFCVVKHIVLIVRHF